MVIPCLCSFRFSSCTAHHKTAVIPIDIPRRWEPRTNQSPTGALIAFAALGTCCSRPVPPTTKNPQTKWPGDHGGAFSTAGEPLSRHIIAAVRALQTKKRRHLGTLQPLLVCFFQLIFVQGNAVQQITLILGGCIIIDSEPFADSTELVKHFNSSRGHSFDFNIHGSTTFQERYVLKSESAALSASISIIGPPDCLAKTRIAPKSRI